MSASTSATSHDFTRSSAEGMKQINRDYTADPALHSGQKPERAYVYCSDSRNPIEEILGVGVGKVFGYRNIGNSFEEPGNPDKVSFDAMGWLAYAVHIGVREVVVLGHTDCGCMKNAYACNCTDHGAHGHGMEAEILGALGKNKKFATELVSEKDAPEYLAKVGLPEGTSAANSHLRAFTVAHTFHQQKLAQGFFKKFEADYEKENGHPLENGPVKVKVEIFDLEKTPCALFRYNDELKKFYNVAALEETSCCCREKSCGCGCGRAEDSSQQNHSGQCPRP